MAFPFSTVHGLIKDHFEDAGFKYVTAEKWVNLEYGLIPDSFKNNAFTIRLEAPERGGSYSNITVNFIIEFSLDALADNYLEKIGTTVTTVRNLKGVLSENGVKGFQNFKVWDLFSTNYIEKFIIQTFNNISFELTDV